MPRPSPAPECTLTLYCQPGARQTRLVGWHGGLPKVQLAAPPVDGAANAALLAWLTERTGLPKRAVTLVAGATARTKRVRLHGLDANQALAALGAAPPPNQG
ncbi:DUF167 domain-containing protein [Tepidimonas aquatica]|uniref:UPF0235 protein Taqua_01645 n=2 Tax=Tepidimonas TaxID=114248 RepID=A0A554WK27_9BURK|nr:DUF167 domain-containing protein [Tepidimonas aquatica]TSE23905.1 hypothetical protein Taqua_01645 [Tepidimonas aquatica]